MPVVDPKTALLVATLMMLANGALLGVMLSDLPKSLRPAAISWQAGTVFVAGGCVVFVFTGQLPLTVLVTSANGLIMLGFTGYWHSVRQLYGSPSNAWPLLPALLGTFAMFVFSFFDPQPVVRIEIVTVVWLFIFGNTARTLKAQAGTDAARSRRSLLGIYVFLMAFVLVRGLYYLPHTMDPGFVAVDASNWMNHATILLTMALPVIGTTAFVLICSERISRQWERAATTDYLTGLANRRTLTEAGVRRSATNDPNAGVALAMIDIDLFKSFNDTHGHGVGDAVLKHVASRLEAVTRDGEMLARVGGEEFVVLLGGIEHEEQARAAGERLRLAVADHAFTDETRRLPVTVSIGVALARVHPGDFDALLRSADRALYAAKAAGRNRVEVASTSAIRPGPSDRRSLTCASSIKEPVFASSVAVDDEP